ncbi:phosphate ABC transporter permease subunit PstC [Pleurocapsa sp. CCALA 161]|uniref:phosphate ABC transporter permease subunit PstC n=1 Tax=Pleurocapsa sp. CCALA 161 TaxID=2107688 RepID=UPI000D04CBE5|nr:phosphate ABC transporter permease subunit PstC [Pleurocapsa sp. CCALA 161]PSB09103.1 phosphate ABC transporter permease subunit PstC [Pleurocapsa sp. CCALA 161]
MNDPASKIESRSGVERSLDNAFYWSAKLLAFAIAGVLVWITIQVAIAAMPAIKEFGLKFLFSSSWNPVKDQYGVWPAIYGTIVSSAIALAISVPIGLGAAIFLSEDYLHPAMQRVIVFLVELLAAVPSVVYGLWGIFVLIPFLKGFTPLKGQGMLPAALILSVMILPTIAAIARDAITNVDIGLRQASFGLGATRWETIMQIILPAASSGIIGGIMLALGRALGETMAVTMLIGNSNRVAASIFAPSNTVSSLLANQFAEASGLQVAALMYAALILFVITLVVNVLAQLLVTRMQRI